MQLTALTLLAALAAASPHHKRNTTTPIVKGKPTVIGNLADPSLNRDSCGSVKFASRALWVCRDSQPYDANGIPTLPVFSSSASWTDLTNSNEPNLTMYGDNAAKSFYPLVEHCDPDNEAGTCTDGTRWPAWANAPPLVVSDDGENVVAYAFVPNIHLGAPLEDYIPGPSTTLYKLTYAYSSSGGEADALPDVEIVNRQFWGEWEIPYGVYGSLVSEGKAYLYAQLKNGDVALARVPVADLEDWGKYEFYIYDLGFTTKKVEPNNPDVVIPNVSAGGQGTYYYSEHWQEYVWIGQAAESVSADFFITTAPKPEGPWAKPVQFYSGVNGNSSLGAYTLQANPALSSPDVNEIYLTYTKADEVGDDVALYTTPLIRVEWE